MVGPVVSGIVAGTAGALTATAYYRLRGCSGGHAWGEWEPTNRWETIPVRNRETLCINRQHRRECTRSGCEAHESEFRGESHEVYVTALSEALSDVTAAHHECPQCHEVVPSSERETQWISRSMKRNRYERCPNCGMSPSATMWTFVPWEDFDE